MGIPARIAHRTHGRIRIEIPGRRRDRAYFAALAARLAQDQGVTAARGNASAASLVVDFAGPFEHLIDTLRRHGLEPAAAPARNQAGLLQLAHSWAVAGGKVQSSPMLVAGAAFGLVGIIQTIRGDIMLPALSAFWYAASALRLAQLPPPGNAGQGAAAHSGEGGPSTLP